jgi:hypothetical protein
VGGGKAGDKRFFEGLDSAFGIICAVVARGHELDGDVLAL